MNCVAFGIWRSKFSVGWSLTSMQRYRPESLVDCCSVVESCGYDVGAADPVENVDGSSRFVVSYVEPAG